MSAADAMSPECGQGVLQSGVVVGKEMRLGELDCYYAAPPNAGAPVILFLTDIHGWQLSNNRLLTDKYAQAGFHVYMPDFFQGYDAIV